MLIGEGKWHDPKKQVTLPRALFAHVHDAALWAWEKIDADAKFKGSYTKVIQGVSETYADFIGRLMEAIEKQVKGKETQELLSKQLAFENANEDCQAILRPIKEKEDIMGYLKACRNVGSIKHQARINAVEAYAIQRQDKGKCFNCGRSGHFRKDCRAPPNRATVRKPPGPCPRCRKGNHWARDCPSNLGVAGHPNSGNLQWGQPQAPQNQGIFPAAAPLPNVEFQSSNQ